jgi:DNA transposition AAA+ family ATPase
MALSIKQRTELLTRTLPQRKQIMGLLTEYLQRTGLSTGDFARRINYADCSIRFFLAGHYGRVASDDTAIRAAILDFINAHPIEPVTESNGRLYDTQNVRLIREYFYQALDGRRAYFFRGAPGSQKTFVLQHLIAELNRAEISKNGHGRRAFYVYCRQGIKPTQLMKRVAEAAGAITGGDVDRILRNLRFDLGSRKALFVFDEAQHLDIDCLETLRELHDMPPRCGLLFAGSHELEKTFQRLDMEQWNSRLRKGEELPGIQQDEAASIIRAELGDVKQEKAESLIRKCYTTDLRKGREVKYISARLLFFALQEIQEKQAARAKGATA